MNKTVISASSFGRISVLDTDKEIVMRYMTNCARVLETLDKQEIKKQYSQAIGLALQELNAIVEAIVFTDSFVEFKGYGSTGQSELYKAGLYQFYPEGWYYTHVWEEAANEYISLMRSEIPIEDAYLENKEILHADAYLNFVRPDLVIYGRSKRAITAGGLDLERLADYAGRSEEFKSQIIKDPEWSDEEFLERLNNTELMEVNALVKILEEYLGADWEFYCEHIIADFRWPKLFRTAMNNHRESISVVSDILMCLSLFAEYKLAQENSSTVVSSIYMGKYVSSLHGIESENSRNIQRQVLRSYQDRLVQQLEKFNVGTLNLQIPSTLRMCLKEADSVREVLENAVKLRKTTIAGIFRAYINELISEDRPEKLASKLQKLESYIEASLKPFNPLAMAGVAISTGGTRSSLNVSSLLDSVTKWINPVIMLNTSYQRNLCESDSISDLSRVLKMQKSDIAGILIKHKIK